MCETAIGYTLPESAWAWLLWVFGAKDASALPIRGEQDLAQGEAFLADAGLLLGEDDYTAVEPEFAWIANEVVTAGWTLDIAPLDGEAFALLRCSRCFILAERIPDSRLTLIPIKDWREVNAMLTERVQNGSSVIAGVRDADTQWQSGAISADQLKELFGQLYFQDECKLKTEGV